MFKEQFEFYWEHSDSLDDVWEAKTKRYQTIMQDLVNNLWQE